MPETIRTANERLRSRPRRGGFLAAFDFCSVLQRARHAGLCRGGGSAEPHRQHRQRRRGGEPPQAAAVTLTLGLVCFAILAAIVLLRTRKAAATHETAAHDETMALHAEIDRLKTLLLSQPQVLVAWAGGRRRAGNLRRHRHRRAGRACRTRARLRHLAGAGGGATHAARGRHAARRRPRLRDDAHHAAPAVRSRRKGARWRGARCCACATSAASRAS